MDFEIFTRSHHVVKGTYLFTLDITTQMRLTTAQQKSRQSINLLIV